MPLSNRRSMYSRTADRRDYAGAIRDRMCIAGISFYSGNENAKRHIAYAVFGCLIGFGSQIIVDFFAVGALMSEELLTSKVPRSLETKTKLFGFEIGDLLLIFINLSVLNLVFGSSKLRYPLVWGSTALLRPSTS